MEAAAPAAAAEDRLVGMGELDRRLGGGAGGEELEERIATMWKVCCFSCWSLVDEMGVDGKC